MRILRAVLFRGCLFQRLYFLLVLLGRLFWEEQNEEPSVLFLVLTVRCYMEQS